MITRVLHVGDIHAEPSSLDDCTRLFGLVAEVAVEHRVDLILLEGDQHL